MTTLTTSQDLPFIQMCTEVTISQPGKPRWQWVLGFWLHALWCLFPGCWTHTGDDHTNWCLARHHVGRILLVNPSGEKQSPRTPAPRTTDFRRLCESVLATWRPWRNSTNWKSQGYYALQIALSSAQYGPYGSQMEHGKCLWITENWMQWLLHCTQQGLILQTWWIVIPWWYHYVVHLTNAFFSIASPGRAGNGPVRFCYKAICLPLFCVMPWWPNPWPPGPSHTLCHCSIMLMILC